MCDVITYQLCLSCPHMIFCIKCLNHLDTFKYPTRSLMILSKLQSQTSKTPASSQSTQIAAISTNNNKSYLTKYFSPSVEQLLVSGDLSGCFLVKRIVSEGQRGNGKLLSEAFKPQLCSAFTTMLYTLLQHYL